MKISSLGFVILSLLICTNFHSASSYSCYNDTESLNEAIFISGESQKTYHICAGTKIKTGNFDNNQDKYVNGSHPIIMAYSGIKVLCGAHGNVEDNCVFSNGETGVEIIHPGYYKPPVDSVIMLNNLYIEGFTFSELTNVPIYSYYAALGGVDITVKNCKFLNNKVTSIIAIQTLEGRKENIVIEDCQFIHNTLSKYSVAPQTSLIEGYINSNITITRSMFLNNIFDETVTLGLIVFGGMQRPSSTAVLSITDSCFEGNINLTSNLGLASNANENGIIYRNYAASNTFKGPTFCNGIVLPATATSPTSTCKDDDFQENFCFVTATSSPTPQPTLTTSAGVVIPVKVTKYLFIVSSFVSTFLF